MSSHHIVRDEQEPALIIAEPNASTLALVQPLLEWSPTIIVLSACVDSVLSWGIKVDVIICEADELAHWTAQAIDQAPIKIMPRATNTTQLATALAYLVERKYSATNIVAMATPSLIDEVASLATRFHIGIVNSNGRTHCVARTYKKWVAKGSTFQIAQHNAPIEVEQLTIENQVYTAKADGMVRLSSSSPFWLTEQL